MKRAYLWLLLATPVFAQAASETPDASFFKHAAEGGLAEVDAGNLAQSKGSSQAVKDFGAMMVKDHGAANQKLQAVASAQNITLPTSASILQMASEKKLELLSGDTFDKSYIKDQIKDHRSTIALFKREIANGTDPEAKDFATATLPVLQGHLRAIEKIAADAGVTTH